MKKLQKTIAAIIAIGMVLAMLLSLSACNKDKITFIIYNWEEYIDEDIIESFKEYYKNKEGKDIEIKYSTFDTNETMLTKIINGDAKVDVICPSEYAIERLLKKGMLAKLDIDKMENYANIDPMITANIDEFFGKVETPNGIVNMNDYFVPYLWGTLGILYNTEKVRAEDLAQGWGLLWNKANNPELNGKILMKDSIRDSIAATVFYLKEIGALPEAHKDKSAQELINAIDTDLLAAVEKVLKEQKPILKGYEVDFGQEDMMLKYAYVDLAWSGDALFAIDETEHLAYFVPESGGNIWFDGWVVPTTSAHKDIAMMWIDYLCNPVIAMKNMIETGYTAGIDPQVMQETPDAITILQDNNYDIEEFFSNPNRYPTEVEHLGIMEDLDEFSSQAVDMWERVKAESHGPNIWIIVFSILGGLIIVGGAVAYFLTAKKRRRFTVARPAIAKMEVTQKEVAPNAEAEQALKEPAESKREDFENTQMDNDEPKE